MKKNKMGFTPNLILVFLISLIGVKTFAKTKVIALGSGGKIKDFKEYLINNPSYTSLSQNLIEEKKQFSDKLIADKFNLAVKGLVLKDLTPSIFIFKEIIDLYKIFYIFSDKSLKTYSETFYRLSNIDRTHSDFWMTKGLYFNPLYEISEDIFNPNIVNEHNTEKKRLAPYFYKFNTKLIKPLWSRLFVNGFEVKNEGLIHPSQSYTLLYYREGKIPLHAEHEGSEFPKMQKPKMTSMNFGSCQKPKFFEATLKKVVDAVFYSKGCIILKEDYNRSLLAQSKTSETSNSSLELFKNASDFYERKTEATNVTTVKDKTVDLSKPLKKKAFFKRKKTWYMIAGGVILTSVATHFLQNQPTGPKEPQIRPVHHGN